ncbi:MAG: ABC transporter ATP-binding protein, partial [Treponema sp.]|nr:ABC transporter ATP-binding protein [Treponema sp.]
MSLLEVKNLTVGKYDPLDKLKENLLKAADNISFSIEEGEITGIAGESGCGKSMTALSIINLLPDEMRITGGEIIFNNQSLQKMTERELYDIRGRDIGIIFQDTRQSLNPLMRVGKQIAEMLELQKIRTEEHVHLNREQKNQNKEQVLELLKSLGFNHPEKIFDAFPHQLSGGMCQRAVTAMAAICRPKLLLADEPSSSLDEDSYKRVLSLLLEMNQKYKTAVLIISHDL